MVAFGCRTFATLLQGFLLTVRFVIAQETYWVDPPPSGPNAGTGFENNTLVREGSKRTLKWHTEFPKSIVLLCQEYQHGSPASIWITPQFTRENETEWTVDTSSFNLGISPVFYIALWALSEEGTKIADAEVRTDYFNITAELVAPSPVPNASDPPSSTFVSTQTTFSTRLATSTTSSSTVSVASTSPTGPSTSLPSATSGASAHISTGAAAGIGIACTIAFVAATSILVWYLRRGKEQKVAQRTEGVASMGNSGEHILSGGSEMYEVYVNPEELPTQLDHHELDGRTGRRLYTGR